MSKKLTKRLVALLVVLTMVFALVPMGVIGAEVEGTGYSYAVGYVQDYDYSAPAEAYGYADIAPLNVRDEAWFRAQVAAGGTIILTGDFILLTSAVPVTNTVNLIGTGTLVVGANHRHFLVEDSGHLTLAGDVTLSRVAGYTENGGGVYVRANGKFTMNGGIISNNQANSGGGVRVAGSGALFTMNAGTIIGNSGIAGMSGGAIHVGSHGHLDEPGPAVVLNGGHILYNSALHFGGALRLSVSGSLYVLGNTEIRGNWVIDRLNTGFDGIWVNYCPLTTVYISEASKAYIHDSVSLGMYRGPCIGHSCVYHTDSSCGTAVYQITMWPSAGKTITGLHHPNNLTGTPCTSITFTISDPIPRNNGYDFITVTMPDGNPLTLPAGAEVIWEADGTITVTVQEEGGTVATSRPGGDIEIHLPDGGTVVITPDQPYNGYTTIEIPEEGGTVTVPGQPPREIELPDGGIVIIGPDGSIVYPNGNVLWGDVDGNGTVNLTDVVVLAAFVNSGHTTVMPNPAAANWHGLGYRNSTLTHVIQLASYVNFRTPLPRP